jgi:hypothetical protein
MSQTLVRRIGARAPLIFRKAQRAADRTRAAAALHEGIGEQAHELAHRIKRRLLRGGTELTGGLRQA